jgi:hypothetical protein
MKSQDVMIAALLAAYPGRAWTYPALAEAAGLSPSALFRSVERLRFAGLVVPNNFRVFEERLVAFIEHGVPYVFPVAPAKLARGVPTAHSAAPLNEHIGAGTAFVWPYAEGKVRGESIEPLAPSVPQAALRDATLYRILALIDAVRVGRPREKKLAMTLLNKELQNARVVSLAR